MQLQRLRTHVRPATRRDAIMCHWLSPCLKVQGPGDQCVNSGGPWPERDSGFGEMSSAQLELVRNRILMLDVK